MGSSNPSHREHRDPVPNDMEEQTAYAPCAKSCAQGHSAVPSKAPHSHLKLLKLPSLFPLLSASNPQQLTPTHLHLHVPITEEPKQLPLPTPFLRSPASATLHLCHLTLLVPLLCIASYPLAASAASLVTTAESTALGIHQHRVAATLLHPARFLRYQLVLSASAASMGGRSSQTMAQEGSQRCCTAPITAPKPPAWTAGGHRVGRTGQPHLYIHVQMPARVQDPCFGCLGHTHCPCPSPWPHGQPKQKVLVCQHQPSPAGTHKQSRAWADTLLPADVLLFYSKVQRCHSQDGTFPAPDIASIHL